MATVIIRSPSELKAALDNAQGDVTFLLAPSTTPYRINHWYGLDSGGRIEIKALDVDDPPVFARVFLRGAHNVTFDGVRFDSGREARPDYWSDVDVEHSTNITIKNSVMKSFATGFYDGSDLSEKGRDFIRVVHSNDVLIENNHVSGHYDPFTFVDVENLIFRGNLLEGIQNDGLHGGQFTNALITDNVFRDFFGGNGLIRHSDMIQIWSQDTTAPTDGLHIHNNLFLSNAEFANQTIFIQNRLVNKDITALYKNISIRDNVIYNGSTNGIYVDATDGLVIRDNTVIWDQLARSWEGTRAENAVPRITIQHLSVNVDVSDNVIAWPIGYPHGGVGSNVVVSYDGTDTPNAVERVFIGPFGAEDLAHLQFRPDWTPAKSGFGAADSVFDPTPDRLTPVFAAATSGGDEALFRLDARLSANTGGLLDPAKATFTWKLPGGVTRTGAVIEHRFGDGLQTVTLEARDGVGGVETTSRAVYVPASQLFDLAFGANGPYDASTYGTKFKTVSAAAVVERDGAPAYRLAGGSDLELGGGQAHLGNLEQFSIELDLLPETVSTGARMIAFLHRSLEVTLQATGEIGVRLVNSAGQTFSMTTKGAAVNVGEWSHVVVSYDGYGGRASVYADGVLVGEMAAAGPMLRPTAASWTLGHPWGAGFEGLIRTFGMTDDPTTAAAAATLFRAAREGAPPPPPPPPPPAEDDGGSGSEPNPAPTADLTGGSGADQLVFVGGMRTAAGGDGSDVFRFDARSTALGVDLVILDLDFAEGDRIEFRHFRSGLFDDGVDPANALVTRFGGRHADVDSIADLREIARGAAGLVRASDGDAILILPAEDGRTARLELTGVSYESLL